MRQIKIRAWYQGTKRMYNWSELLEQNLKNIFTMPKHCGYILLQYTGLQDMERN